MDARERLREGWDALEEARWDAARAVFADLCAAEETADALDGLGFASWCLGDVDGGLRTRERAFAGYVRDGRCDDAARLAVWVSHQHLLAGRDSAARGWLARAERAIAGVGECVGRGWVVVERARHAAGPEECLEHAGRALAIAQAAGSDDLEVFALSLIGRAQIDAGRRDDGLALLEEAMVAASAGRVRNVHTLAEAYCNLIMGCAAAGEWTRTTEWCAHVDAFAVDAGGLPLVGVCRTVHADVLFATGRWEDAERALQQALEASATALPALGVPTLASLAELRVHQGRLAEAAQLLRGREEQPATLRALAALRVAEGRAPEAVALLERGLQALDGDVLRATQLLSGLVGARLAAGDVAGAATAAARLSALAAETGLELVAAHADLATARARTAGAGDASEPARRALAAFGAIGMPFEAAAARLELARAIRDREPGLAGDEARVALAAFRELGAVRAVDRAAGLLRELDVATPGRPRTSGPLTAREDEVLALVARGMTNAQIAASLVISEKTAGHHVSRILGKLGVRNRAEAAALAASGAVGTR